MVDAAGGEAEPATLSRGRAERRDIRRLLSGHWRGLAGIVVLSLVAGLSQAALLLLVVRAGSTLVVRGQHVEFSFGPLPDVELSAAGVFALLIGLAACLLAAESAAAVVASHLAARTLDQLRTSLYGAYASAAWSIQDTERGGHLQELVMTNTSNTAQAALIAATGLASLVGVSTLLIAALAVDAVGALTITAVLALLALGLNPMRHRARHQSETIVATNLELVSALSEGVELAQEITVMGVGDAVKATFLDADRRVVAAWRKKYRLQRLAPALFRDSALLLVLAAMGMLYALDVSSFATLSVVVLLLVRAVTYAQGAQVSTQQLTELLPWATRVWDSIDAYRAAAPPSGTTALDPVQSIRFGGVSFAYVPGRPALHDVDFTLAQGEAVGVIGPSGAGKSTLVQLLLGLRQPDTGTVEVNGRDVRDYRRVDFCRRVAFVPQDTRTLAGTVSDNIRFYRPGIEQADVEAAAVSARLDEDINGWPLGYETMLRERGGGLSGGQRQRLALARALAGRPDVLVLDEPTSALDARSEALVHETLRSLAGRVLLVVVAHRMSTLRMCDRLIVLESGVVTDIGAPEQLKLSSDFYQEAVRLSGA